MYEPIPWNAVSKFDQNPEKRSDMALKTESCDPWFGTNEVPSLNALKTPRIEQQFQYKPQQLEYQVDVMSYFHDFELDQELPTLAPLPFAPMR